MRCKVSTQVRFNREERKAALRDGQGAQKIGSSLSFTKIFFFNLVLFVEGGKLGVGVEWPFDISFIETHSVGEGKYRSQEWSVS
jgi:hypothetical protein